MPRLVIEVMYDGTQFNGSQIQGDQPTVQLALNKALSTVLRTPIATYGASRTDEGVHALSNYYHFDIEQELAIDLPYKCNAVLPQGVAIRNIYRANDPELNVRFAAVSRLYRYRIYRHKDPFLHERALYYPFPLNEEILHATAEEIKRHTHFESFSKRNSQSKTFTCHITRSEWRYEGEELQYIVEANRFLRGMVRGLVATQLRIAKANRPVDDLIKIIEARDCTKAWFDVPGHGLYLEEIKYPEGLMTPISK